MGPYRTPPQLIREPRPRTLLGRLRSLSRRLTVWWGGPWRSRWAWCWVCHERIPNFRLPGKLAPFCQVCTHRAQARTMLVESRERLRVMGRRMVTDLPPPEPPTSVSE